MRSACFLLLLVNATVGQKKIAEVRYSWRYLNYTWTSTTEHDNAITNGDYIPKNNVLIGIKVWKDKFYLAMARLKAGVPVTLATAPYQPIEGNQSPNLQPYPNWEMQKADNCDALQTVQAMEIDPYGRMWVLNVGRVIYENSTRVCRHRLVIFDLENNGKILLDYAFPKDVVDPDTGYLNDIVLDHSDGGYAYITNSDEVKPSIVVFSLVKLSSWQVQHYSMRASTEDVSFRVKGESLVFNKPSTVNGIALESANVKAHRYLYYTPLSSHRIFYVDTAMLKAAALTKRNRSHSIDGRVNIVTSTPGTHTAGMIVDSNNQLYFGMLEVNTVATWSSITRNYTLAYMDPRMQWIDTYAIDEMGNLWVTINLMPRINADKIKLDDLNYYVIRLDQLEFKNYQYYGNGSAPTLPVINH